MSPDPPSLPATPGSLGDGSPRSPRRIIEAWLVGRRSDGRKIVLLLRRSDPQGGFWQGVSGKVEPRDGNLRATVVREVHEETGWSLGDSPIQPVGCESVFRGYDGVWYRKRSFLVTLDPIPPRPPALSEEHVAHRWVPIEEAPDRMDLDVYRDELRALLKTLAD